MSISKLKSGNWRAQVYNKRSGERPSKTFKTKKEAMLWEAEWYDTHRGESIDFATAMKKFINARRHVLSPATIRVYEGYEQYYGFKDSPVDALTEYALQLWVDGLSTRVGAKTVRNVYFFAVSVIHAELPDKRFNVHLPTVYPKKLYMPSEMDIKRLLEAVKGTEWQVPVSLGLCGLRRGEICALALEDIGDGFVYVDKSLAKSSTGWVLKRPKNKTSCRRVAVPKDLTDKIKKEGAICTLSPNTLSDKFPNVLKRAGIHEFRFHDLRAYFASAQHLVLGIPEHYTMVQGGWSNISTMRKIYTRSIDEAEIDATDKWINYLSNVSSNVSS